MGTSLAVQWLRLHASNAGDAGSIPGQELGSRMLHSTAKKLKTYMLKFLWSRLGILGQYHQGALKGHRRTRVGGQVAQTQCRVVSPPAPFLAHMGHFVIFQARFR